MLVEIILLELEIIIPTAYREDYTLTLRKLTRQREPQAFVRMSSKIHEYSSTIRGSNMAQMQSLLEKSNAFMEPTEGKLKLSPTNKLQ